MASLQMTSKLSLWQSFPTRSAVDSTTQLVKRFSSTGFTNRGHYSMLQLTWLIVLRQTLRPRYALSSSG